MPPENWAQLLEDACTHEEKLEKLYALLAEQFPEDREFWKGLGQEEHRHSALLRQLKTPLGTGALKFDESSMRPQAIQSAIAYIEAMTSALERRPQPYLKILSEITDFQQNLLESGLFWALQAPAGKEFPVIEQLAQATEQQRVRLEQKWQQEKNKANAL